MASRGGALTDASDRRSTFPGVVHESINGSRCVLCAGGAWTRCRPSLHWSQRDERAARMSPEDILENRNLSRTPSGLWVAQDDPSGPSHALGLVVAGAAPPAGPKLVLPFRPVVRDG